MSNDIHQKTSYRPDIDGLRAIAVLAVLIFHAFPEKLPGGFVGVDIFFVISGYLITRIMLKDFQNNQFNIVTFYSKRIKRIFPSLTLVLLCILIISWLVLLPNELAELGKHIAGGAGFIANIILWKEVGYFDTLSELKPLLHLWSLAIEEQYYIVWPLFLALFWNKKKIVVVLIALIFLISFSINIFMLKIALSGAFYSPVSRFWEILIGAALAFFQDSQKNKIINNQILDTYSKLAQSIIGLLLIAHAILTYNNKTLFPGWYALVPTVGTILIINSSKSSFINSKVLSNKLLVFIGLISYPLYLWHWPLLAIARITNEGTVKSSTRTIIVLLSFILSIITYKYIEKPFRLKKETGILKHASTILFTLLLCLGISGFFINQKEGLPNRLVLKNNQPKIVNWSLELPGTVDCLKSFTEVPSSFCRTTQNPQLAIVGDSHAGAIFAGFISSTHKDFNKAIIFGSGSCQPTLGHEERVGCNDQLLSALTTIKNSPKIKTVILTSYFRPLISDNPAIAAKYMQAYSRNFFGLLTSRLIS